MVVRFCSGREKWFWITAVILDVYLLHLVILSSGSVITSDLNLYSTTNLVPITELTIQLLEK